MLWLKKLIFKIFLLAQTPYVNYVDIRHNYMSNWYTIAGDTTYNLFWYRRRWEKLCWLPGYTYSLKQTHANYTAIQSIFQFLRLFKTEYQGIAWKNVFWEKSFSLNISCQKISIILSGFEINSRRLFYYVISSADIEYSTWGGVGGKGD